MDLDRFKETNDEFGHASGDDLLAFVGRHLAAQVAENGAAARVGGDEFLLVATVGDAQEARALGHGCLVDDAREGGPVISTSVGLATAPWGAVSMVELEASADAAMYRAKRAGGHRAEVTVLAE